MFCYETAVRNNRVVDNDVHLLRVILDKPKTGLSILSQNNGIVSETVELKLGIQISNIVLTISIV